MLAAAPAPTTAPAADRAPGANDRAMPDPGVVLDRDLPITAPHKDAVVIIGIVPILRRAIHEMMQAGARCRMMARVYPDHSGDITALEISVKRAQSEQSPITVSVRLRPSITLQQRPMRDAVPLAPGSISGVSPRLLTPIRP